MKHVDCPNCSHSNPRNWRSCVHCGFILKVDPIASRAVEYVPCRTCSGTGLIYLDYLDGFEENPETQWLPCTVCDGTGQRNLAELREEAFKKDVTAIVLGILDALG